MFRILEEGLDFTVPQRARVRVYLPVGVCSKNDKGACINEFNILQNFKSVSDSVGDGASSLTSSCNFFELLNAHNNNRTIVAIARKTTDRS